MRIIFLGMPASGKGTQSDLVSKYYDIPHISTGDIFRSAIEQRTPAGIEAEKYIHNGKFVPNEITIQIVKDRIMQSDCQKGFILDGFPRNIEQGHALDTMLSQVGLSIDFMFYLKIDLDELRARVLGRLVCPVCGATYHLTKDKPHTENECDECHSPLSKRKDDNEESLKIRLEFYDRETRPLVDFYRSQNRLISVDGRDDKWEVFKEIQGYLEAKK